MSGNNFSCQCYTVERLLSSIIIKVRCRQIFGNIILNQITLVLFLKNTGRNRAAATRAETRRYLPRSEFSTLWPGLNIQTSWNCWIRGNILFREFSVVHGVFWPKSFRAVVIFMEGNTFKLAFFPFYVSIPYPESLSFSAIRGKEKQVLCIFFIENNIIIFL